MTSIQELFTSISERIQTSASVKAVYGEPVTAEGKTIIPVARVYYGFGGGGGTRGNSVHSEEAEQPVESGGGGGGGAAVVPVGLIEITAGEIRYVSFDERRKIVRMLVFGAVVGIFLLTRRRRRV